MFNGPRVENRFVLSDFINKALALTLPFFYIWFPGVVILIILARVLLAITFAVLEFILERGPRHQFRRGFDLPNRRETGHWSLSCSICFDANHDLYLDNCKDQFCRDCFNRYVKEVVKNSWGLTVAKIKCPVCQDPIHKSEWTKYVDTDVVKLYNTYNQPYRPVTRCCGQCGEAVFVAQVYKNLSLDERINRIVELSEICQTLLNHSKTRRLDIQNFMSHFEMDYQYFIEGDASSGKQVYCKTIDRLQQALRSSEVTTQQNLSDKQLESVSNISLRLIATELNSETWRELQFEHIARFPKANCKHCKSPTCLKCATPSHHDGLNCLDHMREKLKAGLESQSPGESKDDLENIKWTLENSKSCPYCQILIYRDEGCHRVDCLYCAHSFCWICLQPWSERCGFYQCQTAPVTSPLPAPSLPLSPSIPSSPSHHQVVTELGVPDIVGIEKRRRRHLATSPPRHHL